MADGNVKSIKKRPPVPPAESARLVSFRAGADAQLLEMVRLRPVLYDPSHLRFMDTNLKNAMWNKIGKELKANPSACKRRWYNIRDNYRKVLRRQCLTGGKMTYKFADALGFLDPFMRGQFDSSAAVKGTKNDEDNSEENSEEETQHKTETQEESDQSEDDTSNRSESAIDFDMFDKSVSVSASLPVPASSSLPAANTPDSGTNTSISFNTSQSQVVDSFLSAIGPMLKGLNPYQLSLAKAEIFATVHKYELKAVVDNGWSPSDVNPLP